MAATASTMLELGTPAPEFTLPDAAGRAFSLRDFDKSEALLVIFMCNHCPFVKHLAASLAQLDVEYRERGVAMVGINSNDFVKHPDDAPPKMSDFAREYDITFPYLVDESQSVAKAYRAACTPDFYIFGNDRKLFYRGQFDDSRPNGDAPITGEDLRNALDALLRGEKPAAKQMPSIGCNIKWKPGNEPAYFGA